MTTTYAVCSNVFVRRPTVLSHLIAWATRGKKEGPVLATHMVKFITPRDIISAEFQGGVVRLSWEEYVKDLRRSGAEWCILERRTPIEVGQCTVAYLIMKEMIGWKYNWGAIPLQLMDGLLSKLFYRKHSYGLDAFLFRKLESWKFGIICSETCARVDRKLGWVPSEMRCASPDEMWDYQWKGNPGWKLTEHSEGWFVT